MAEGHGSSGAAQELHAPPTDAVLFIVTCILIGISTKFFLHRIKVPYTALLLIWGLLIGLLQAANPQTHAFTATLSLWMSIDPHLLLLIFLPTIGFSAALSQQPHLLRRNWGQILILAWPGVAVTFVLIGLCARYVFPYGWSWAQCLLFGAMLSATDPVAVVAVLHEVGADDKLSSIIDGESLVNDGSALVIFLVLQQFVQGASLSAGQITVLFVRLAFVGVALGLGFCVVTSLWLAYIFRDPELEIVLTLGAAYACYFVAEELCGASGLLAVVSMGFAMSLLGGRHITQRIKVEMHAFWAALEWLANTILFLWVGIALAFVLAEPANPALRRQELRFAHHLVPSDAGYAVVLYFWLLLARGASIFLFYPLLSTGRVGYPLTWRAALFMVWAGLRGAVGVAMSLFVLLDPLIASDEFKAHCVFFMALMAFATVLVNGTSAKAVLTRLGLLDMSEQQLVVLRHVLEEVDAIPAATLATVQPDPVLGPPRAPLVRRWANVGAAASLSPAHCRVLKHLDTMASAGRPGRADSRKTEAAADAAVRGGQQHSSRVLVQEYRSRLLHVVKASYGDMYQHWELNTTGIGVLQEATDKALDAAEAPDAATAAAAAALQPAAAPADPENGLASAAAAAAGGGGAAAGSGSALCGGLTDWQLLLQELEAPSWLIRGARAAAACRLPGKVADGLQQRDVAAKLQLVSAFVAAHTTAQELISQHLASNSGSGPGGGSNGSMARGGGGGGSSAHKDAAAGGGKAGGAPSPDAHAAAVVVAESRAEVVAAMQYAQEVLLPRHPDLSGLLMSRNVAIGVLEHQNEFLDSVEAAGLVRAEEVHTVQHRAATRLERLQHQHFWNVVTPPPPRDGSSGGSDSRAGAAAPNSSSGGAGALPPDAQAGVELSPASQGHAAAHDAGAPGVQQQRQQQALRRSTAPPSASGPSLNFDDLSRLRCSMRRRSGRPMPS